MLTRNDRVRHKETRREGTVQWSSRDGFLIRVQWDGEAVSYAIVPSLVEKID